MTMSLSAAKYFGRSATHLPNSIGRMGTWAVPVTRSSTLGCMSNSCPRSADEHLPQLYNNLPANVFRGGGEQKAVAAWIDDPAMLDRVPATECTGVETDRDVA